MSHDALHLFVAGGRVSGGGRCTIPVTNPATGEELGRLPAATTADLDEAVEAADRAFRPWRRVTPFERGRILREAAALIRERAEAIALLMTLEEGKPLAESRVEVLVTADIIDWCAEEGRRAYGRIIPARTEGLQQYVLKEPIGPVAAFSPWNAPALMPGRKIAEALAAGCTCVIKPAEETPATALEIARAFDDAGLPAGVLSMVFGEPAEISRHLISSLAIRKATFTGSTEVGRLLGAIAGQHVKPITLELGGHAPVIVCEDADLERAANLATAMKSRNAGQLCGSPTRFLVQEGVHDRFLSLYAERARFLRVGDGRDPACQMGPLANRRRVAAMEAFVEDAVARGARVETGGRRPGDAGSFFAPTVLSQIDRNAAIMNKEPFGPVSGVVPFRRIDEAVEEANRLGYGLAAYAFTRSAATADELIRTLEAGVLGINTFAVVSPETPFGGVKESGYGAEGGSEGVSSYLVNKFVAHAAC
jgi:succinate-semialdehyde dehydrogenase / glutarate-semialdehyde dehydrogenase